MRALCLLLVTSLMAVSLASPQPQPQTPTASGCVSQCQERYRQVPGQISGSLVAAEHPCSKGCKFFALRESSQSTSGGAKDAFFSGCNSDCEEAYKDEHERAQCNTGCSMGSPSLNPEFKEDDDMLGRAISFRIPLFTSFSSPFDTLDRGFMSSFPGLSIFGGNNKYQDRMDRVENGFKEMLGHVRKGIDDSLEEVVPPIESAMNNFKQAMEDMSAHMKAPSVIPISEHSDSSNNNVSDAPSSIGHFMTSQINKLMERTRDIFGSNLFPSMLNDLMDQNAFPKGGNGKLVVIKSGPGFHEEKSYNINADTDISQILKDDMMNEPNPLDNLAEAKEDVEVFDPKAALTKNDKSEDGAKMDIEVFGPLELPYNPFINSDNDIKDSVFEEFAPKLRPFDEDKMDKMASFMGHNIVLVDLCAQDKSKMTWSQWFACLHARVGVPRWLMAMTLCSGILLSIWLCLVIPKNMSKNSNKAKKSFGVKELEAASNPHSAVIILDSKYPVDLPPSYDDVACTKVKPEQSDVAEPLPAKKAANNLDATGQV